MIELKSLHHFVAVAEAGGFRKASARSGVLQSVLSRKIRELEEILGVSVFERHREGVRLTNAGRRFLEEIRGIFAHLDRATSALKAAGSAGEGHLRLGFACSISGGFLRELIRNWRANHPHVALTIRDGSLQELVAAVVQRELDATVTTGAAVPPGCDMEQLWVDRIFLAVASSDPISLHSSVSLAEIADRTFIVNQSNFGIKIRDFLIKNLSDLGVSPSVQIFDVGREMLFTMVGHGFGCTTAATVETGTAYADVAYVPIRDFRLPFNAVWSPANDNPALRRFLSEARTLSRIWVDDPPPGDTASASRKDCLANGRLLWIRSRRCQTGPERPLMSIRASKLPVCFRPRAAIRWFVIAIAERPAYQTALTNVLPAMKMIMSEPGVHSAARMS